MTKDLPIDERAMINYTEIGITLEQTCSPYRWMGEDADAHVKEWREKQAMQIRSEARDYGRALADWTQPLSALYAQQQMTLAQLTNDRSLLHNPDRWTGEGRPIRDFLTGLLQGATVLR